MNIFGFLAVVVICGTVGVLGWRFSKSGVTITKHVYTETKDTTPKVVQQVMSEEDRKEREKIWPYTNLFFEKCGIRLDEKDLLYGDYIEACDRRGGSLKNRIKRIWLFFKSYDPNLGIRCMRIRRTLFAVVRRLPHYKPIRW